MLFPINRDVCLRFVGGAVCLVASVTLADPGDWKQFRGFGGNGVSKSTNHPVQWSEEQNVQWKVAIEGLGWSQPVVNGDRVFVTTAVTENQPKPKTGETGPGFSLFSAEGISRSFLSGGSPPDVTYEWKLLCVDLKTGKKIWEKTVRKSKPTIPIHRSNSYTSETPIYTDQHVYVYIATAGLYCFDLDGHEVWKKELPGFNMQLGWGTGSSPMLFCRMLYVQCDNEKGSYLVALDRWDGTERCRVERDELSNWSTPYLWRNNNQRELVTCGGKKIRSYNLITGELLWELKADGRCVTTPVSDDRRLYVGSVTRSMGTSGTLTAIRVGARGNLSATNAEADSSIAWSVQRAAPEIASPLLYKDRLYTLSQRGGILSCFDAKTGERLYRERLPGASGFTASPWAAGEQVFCLDESGNTYVLAAEAEFRLVETNRLEGMFWSSPAVSDSGSVLLRSSEHLYRIAKE